MHRTVPRVPGHFVLGNLREFGKRRIDLLTRLPGQYGEVARLDIGFFQAVPASASATTSR